MDLVPGRRRLMGSLSGSRKDVRDALEFAATHDVRSRIAERPLEDAGDVLNEMHERRLRDRVVLTVE